MRCIIMRILAILTSLAILAPAAAQTTQPADQAWPATVSDFGQSLVSSDPAALLPLLCENVTVQAFDAKTADAIRLLARVRGGTLVFSRGYMEQPRTLAADIAEAFRNATVPDEIKLKMAPQSDVQMRRANQIALQWVSQTLAAAKDDLVGVSVFWCSRAATPPAAEPSQEMVFVLVKGSAADPAHPRIQSISFGDPQRQAK
jgi:hypothetical protein